MIPRVVILAALLPAVALAQWPSWLSPNVGGFDRGNQVLSGAVERLTVIKGPDAWTNYITTNIWKSYFSQGSKCKAAKNMIAPLFWYPVYRVDHEFSGSPWVSPASSNYPEGAVWWYTKEDLLSFVGAPSNWFDVHPYVAVSQSDYGWKYFPAVLSNMVWADDAYHIYWSGGCMTNTGFTIWFSDSTNTSGYGNYGVDFARNWFGTELPQNAARNFSKRKWMPQYSFLYPAQYQFVGEVHPKITVGLVSATNFYAQGDPVMTNYYRALTWTNSVGGESPLWSMHADPTVMPPTQGGGWEEDWAFGTYYLFKFNAPGLTNGFKWFR